MAYSGTYVDRANIPWAKPVDQQAFYELCLRRVGDGPVKKEKRMRIILEASLPVHTVLKCRKLDLLSIILHFEYSIITIINALCSVTIKKF